MSLAKLLGCNCAGGVKSAGDADSSYAPDNVGYELDVMPESFVPGVTALDQSTLVATPEADWPIGSVANLVAPFPVDRGLWTAPRMVSQFKKAANGRWVSYPGADVNYPTLSALSLAAPVASVFKGPAPAPFKPTPQPGPQPKPEPYPFGDGSYTGLYSQVQQPDSGFTPAETGPAFLNAAGEPSAPAAGLSRNALIALGAGALLLFVVFNKKRR